MANQPGAQNMQEMVWDDELAAKAQQWASQCTFEHDPSRYLGKFYKYLSLNMNIYMSSLVCFFFFFFK